MVRATTTLHEHGQSLWLDNVTREMLDTGKIQHYIDHYEVTGLTSNPAIFDRAIASGYYDEAIRARSGLPPEELFMELAVEDMHRAADLFLPVHERTNGVDGWVSLELSPLLAHDTGRTISAAEELHARVGRPNLMVKIPGTVEGLASIAQCVTAGVPVNVTQLFSPEHYRAAANAYLEGLEGRVRRGLSPAVGSVASVFMSRWDAEVADRVPADLTNRLALAVGQDTYRAYRQLLDSRRVQRLENSGARMQRLLWASTRTKDPETTDTLYVQGLAAPLTICTMPDGTLEAFYEHGDVGPLMPADGNDCDTMLTRFASVGIDVPELAAKLQRDGTRKFTDTWNDLMARISKQSMALA